MHTEATTVPGGDHDWFPVLAAAVGLGLLRLVDILLPKGRHLRALDKWLTRSDDKEAEDEA